MSWLTASTSVILLYNETREFIVIPLLQIGQVSYLYSELSHSYMQPQLFYFCTNINDRIKLLLVNLEFHNKYCIQKHYFPFLIKFWYVRKNKTPVGIYLKVKIVYKSISYFKLVKIYIYNKIYILFFHFKDVALMVYILFINYCSICWSLYISALFYNYTSYYC